MRMRCTLLSLAATAVLIAPVAACGGSDDEASGCSPPTGDLAVGANDDLTFDAEGYEAEAGCIDVTYTNDGTIAHTLLVKGKSGFKLSVGDTDSGTVELPAGTYVLFCDVAGHESAGMEAELVVG
jgi:plastocyanin